MRLLFFADRAFPTDHSFLEGLVEDRIAGRGVEITWVMYSSGAGKSIECANWKHSKVILVPRPARRDPLSLFLRRVANIRRLKAVIRQLDQSEFDLIIVRNDVGFLRLALALSKKWDRKVLFQLSHLKEEQFLAGSPNNGIWRNALDRLKGAGGLFLREITAPKADAVFCISESMRTYLRKKPRYRNTTLHVLPLGVDLAAEARSESAQSPLPARELNVDSFCFVYCGTMASIRRLDFVLRAFRMAADSLSDIYLVLIGGGREPEQVSLLKRLTEELGLSGRVLFKGQLSRQHTRGLLRGCDAGLCIIPPFGVLKHISPTKIMEYMEASLPVIATKGVPEQEEVLSGSEGGLLVEFDVHRVAAAMRRLAANPDEARALGRKARAYIEQERNYDKMADWFLEVLQANCSRTDR